MNNEITVTLWLRRAWWVRPFMAWSLLKAKLGFAVDADAVAERVSQGYRAELR